MADQTIYGGTGDDLIETGPGSADYEVYGGDGNDFIVDGGDNDSHDILYGGAGNDNILGGNGNDTIFGGVGDDQIDGSDGDDTIVLEDGFGFDFIDGGIFSETIGDTLDATAMTGDATLTFAMGGGGGPGDPGDPGGPGPGPGGGTTLVEGMNTANLSNIEQYNLGTGNDTVIDDAGSHSVNMGGGDDTFIVVDGFGNDTVVGGETGEIVGDSLDGSGLTEAVTLTFSGAEAGNLTTPMSNLSFAEIEQVLTGAGDDTVYGGIGNESVSTGAGQDTIFGGDGSDTFDAGAGDDLIAGGTGADTLSGGDGEDLFVLEDGFGNDVITGGENGEVQGDIINGSALTESVKVTFTGSETGLIDGLTDTATFSEIEIIATGSGDDTVLGGTGDDIVGTDAGNDILYGGAGNDIFGAGDGDDTLVGGTGADSLDGGIGNDTITFSEGDSVLGDAGDDMIILEDLGETSNGTIQIDGGSGDEVTGDTLHLGELADMSTLVKVDDGTGSFSGSVTLDDGTILNFSEIENIICFTPGTLIATPQGARDVATLQHGDLVVTRDHGLQPVRWIQSRTVPAQGRFAPVRIRPGVVVGQERDLLVSPQHRMLFHGYRADLLFGESEVLISAKHLIDGHAVTQDQGGHVTYIHMMFDEHEIIYAEGAATESFHPGGVGLSAVTDAARDELFSLFPEIRSNLGGYGDTARRCLKSHEAQLLCC